MRVIVTGSRDWGDRDAVWSAMAAVALAVPHDESLTFVHGGCPTGADAFAHYWAKIYGATVGVFPADWEKHGKRAGPLRNAEMVKAGADLVLAFPLPGGKGTQHMIRIAREAGIPVKVWGEE